MHGTFVPLSNIRIILRFQSNSIFKLKKKECTFWSRPSKIVPYRDSRSVNLALWFDTQVSSLIQVTSLLLPPIAYSNLVRFLRKENATVFHFGMSESFIISRVERDGGRPGTTIECLSILSSQRGRERERRFGWLGLPASLRSIKVKSIDLRKVPDFS